MTLLEKLAYLQQAVTILHMAPEIVSRTLVRHYLSEIPDDFEELFNKMDAERGVVRRGGEVGVSE